MCDLARAHGERVSPPKDNCTAVSCTGGKFAHGFFCLGGGEGPGKVGKIVLM